MAIKDDKVSILSVILVCATICSVIYGNIIFASFFSWDDVELIVNNNHLHSLRIPNIFSYFRSTYLGNYIPLTMFLHGLEWWIGNGSSWPFHLVSISLHLCCSLIVYQLAIALSNRQWVGVSTALLFSCTPIQVESVAWISEQKTVLAGLFYLLAMLYYVKYLKQGRSKWAYFKVLLFFILGLLSKATTVTLPISLLGIVLITQEKKGLAKQWRGLALMASLSLAFGILAIWAQSHDGYLRPDRLELPHGERVVLAMYALVMYVVNITVPYHLSALYPFPESLVWGQYVIAGIGLFCLILALRDPSTRAKRFGWFVMFAGPLVPLLQLIPFGEAFMADRYAYVSCFPLLLLISRSFYRSSMFMHITHRIITIAGVLTILIYTYIAHDRALLWTDEIAFFNDIVNQYPESDIAQFNLATTYKNRNELAAARIHYSRAVDINDDYPQAWLGLGLVNEGLNNCSAAIKNFSQVISNVPDHPNIFSAYYHRARCYQQLGFSKLSRIDLQKSIRQRNDYGPAHYMLAQNLARSGAHKPAVGEYSLALLQGYAPVECLLNRAISYGWLGENENAIDDLNKVIRIDPANAAGWFLRGIAKHRNGIDGCADLRRAGQLGYDQANRAISELCPTQKVIPATPPPPGR